jgi:oligopeptide transport system permease protein
MLRYVLGRLLQAIPVFVGTTFIIYFMVFAMPGDPIIALFGDKTPNPAVLAAIRSQYHLDQPFIVQYVLYMRDVLTGHMGVTFSGRSVSEVLRQTLPVTLRLVILAVLMEFVLSITIGLVSGLRQGKASDNVNLVVALILNSFPIFVIAFLAQYFIGIKWGLAPPTVGADTSWARMLMPAAVIAFTIYATGMRLMRGSVIEARNEDYVRTAYAKGLRAPRVMIVHIARNSLIPVVTNSGASFGALLVGTTVTEGIFNIPGVGNTLYHAITRGEGPTVVSFVTVMVIAYVLVNILVDLFYAVLDPRIRYV